MRQMSKAGNISSIKGVKILRLPDETRGPV